ncbi:GTP-binding protein 10 homolog isoform X2 [Copidosoma floridanum]|uniref:GTP-binding protein 10 homolog isoform X2 n=1 Tax=Copidosoma floridanum TaxID=29053 RepID=UPI000C6F8513|nr:GTP-binding protein 10 homolog isoform X2 [Copidosoma floridanum]
MVFLTQILGYAKKSPLRKYLRYGFMDKLSIKVRGGTGGSGLSKYGGRGGRGGDVYVRAKEGYTLNILSKYVNGKLLAASTGYDSSKRGILGQAGEDLIINVPPGVIVYHENGTLIGEVNELDKKLMVAMGGAGGCTETDYSGQRGENHGIILDLKLISDVALVGFPNAGKSTLIRTISNAKPKVADYPFTTIKPNLGKIIYPDLREITIADLPGLIEGAHVNVGMGHDFLKHLERTKMLLFVIDIQGFQLSYKYKKRNCLETLLLLNKEIELYKPELLDMPAILVINKMDTERSDAILQRFMKHFENLKSIQFSNFSDEMVPEKVLEFEDIITISLKNKDEDKITNLKQIIRKNLDKIQDIEEQKIQDEMPEYKLIRKLKKEMERAAPLLV